MARPDSDKYELTDAEKRDLIRLIEQGKPLPEKFRFLLFDDKREVELVWNGKTREVCTAVLPFQTLEHIDEPRKEKHDDEEFSFDTRGRQLKGWTNKLIWGDNKLILSSLKSGALRRQIEAAGGLKLIYIDPPFDVGADFSMDIEIGGETFHKEPNLLEQIAYRDTWGRGADSFIAMIYERLILMRDLMHEEGSIYVHCDWRVNSFIRLAMNEVFGTNNFINEISWKRAHTVKGNIGQGSKYMGANTDTIFAFAKSPNYQFNNVFLPYSEEYIKTFFKYTESDSKRRYRLTSMIGPGGSAKGNPTYEVMGVTKYWRYRETSPKSPRIEVLKKLMEDYQRQGMAEMQTVTYSLGDGIDPLLAAKHLAGQPFSEALKRLAMICPPLKEESIHQAVLKRCQDPWFALVAQDLIDWDGRIIAKRGSVMSDDPQVREQAIRAEMFRTALDFQKAIVGGFTEPARLQLLSEHNPSFHDFYHVLVDSPFIPPGREYFFMRGLYEGLNGQFLLAAHLLIPQLEHAIRFHLEQHGVDVTTLSREGVQELMDINKLFGLRRDKLLEMLGADQLFELEGLLVRRHGANLRNTFAHGLFTHDQFYDASVLYLWWVTLRLCLLHFQISPCDVID